MIFVLFFRTIVPFCIVYFFFDLYEISLSDIRVVERLDPIQLQLTITQVRGTKKHITCVCLEDDSLFFFFFFFAIAFNAKSFVIAILGFFSFSSPFLEGLAEAF